MFLTEADSKFSYITATLFVEMEDQEEAKHRQATAWQTTPGRAGEGKVSSTPVFEVSSLYKFLSVVATSLRCYA